jgi:hypothetical protein
MSGVGSCKASAVTVIVQLYSKCLTECLIVMYLSMYYYLFEEVRSAELKRFMSLQGRVSRVGLVRVVVSSLSFASVLLVMGKGILLRELEHRYTIDAASDARTYAFSN